VPKFRKKPVVVEARQVTVEDADAVAAWCGARVKVYKVKRSGDAVIEMEVTTQEGLATANYRDWVVRGPGGVVRVYGPEDFESTYEPARE
jgi:hypothetical protein